MRPSEHNAKLSKRTPRVNTAPRLHPTLLMSAGRPAPPPQSHSSPSAPLAKIAVPSLRPNGERHPQDRRHRRQERQKKEFYPPSNPVTNKHLQRLPLPSSDAACNPVNATRK